jgi:hypothetical protein
MYKLTEETIFNEKSFQVEVTFLESLDMAGNYEIVRIVGETMPTQNWINNNITPIHARKQLNNRMQEIIYKVKNPKFPYNKK